MAESTQQRPNGHEGGTSTFPITDGPSATERDLTTVLVVSPHPDDAESGAGGIISKWTKMGRKVDLVVCTNGDKGSSDKTVIPENLAQIRESEQQLAAKVMGISELVFLRHRDQTLTESYELREQISRQIRLYRPETVVTVDPNRPYIRHPDHYVTGRVTLNCVFPLARDVLAFPEHIQEGLESHKVREILLWGSPEPDTFLDVKDSFETKLEALSQHRSQVEQGWELREVRSRTRYSEIGRRIGVLYAEAFKRIEVF